MVNSLLKKLSVFKDETILNCLKKLNSTNKQFVYVKNNKDKLIGILTDADVRRALLKKKKLSDSIKNIYNPSPKFVFEGDSIDKIQSIFKKTKVNVLLVVNKKKQVVNFFDVHSISVQKKIQNSMVIMAGGKGLRLRPFTVSTPKPLMLLDRKITILENLINSYKEIASNKVFVITNYLSNKIINKIDKNKNYSRTVEIIKENKELGSIGGVSCINKKKLNFPIIISNGDIVSDLNFSSLISFHKMMKNNLTVVLKPIENRSSFGEVFLKKFQITKIEEKKIKTSFINAGIYCMDEKMFDLIKNEFLNMDTLINMSIKKKLKIGGYPMLEFWMDIGNKENLEKIRNIFRKR
ncbi:sugar phosphate nucleotidyltransferase [Candidatus Pelagibacter ubique]|nr:sugar phosphate nucleotidyltransferase [Candidatus Pelagibacter ubique]